ncbi:hypothetical protein [Streptococcus pluranimalium]|uniref:hypothetical protein n=1 Tax=Streptococcus pluranimalium TaxID=82348 RepID=UPI003F692BA1
MTSITFLDKPNILVFKIKDDSVVAYNTLLDYSESDFVFPVLDKWVEGGILYKKSRGNSKK